MAKRCLIVSYYFPPTGGGGVQRITKLIKYLSLKGWQFSVITTDQQPNVPNDPTLLQEIPDKINIYKINSSLNSSSSFLFRIIKNFKTSYFIRWLSSYVFLPDIRLNWLKPVREKVYDLFNTQTFDLVLFSSPPYSLAKLAAELSDKIPVPVVVDMRDPWTTNPYKIHPTEWHFKCDRQIEINAIKKIKYGISVTESLIEFYKKNINDFNSKSWRFIPNGFDSMDFKKIIPEKLAKDKFHIAFSGTFYSHINRPHLLFKALSVLPDDTRDKIRFHHVGDSVVDLKKLAESFNLSNNVITWGYQNHAKCLDILSGMNALCFILDSANSNSKNTIGGKVYEYLNLDIPILALIPDQGDAADFIRNTNSGVIIDPYKSEEIAAQLAEWITNGVIVKNKNKRDYERSNLADQFDSFFCEILEKEQN